MRTYDSLGDWQEAAADLGYRTYGYPDGTWVAKGYVSTLGGKYDRSTTTGEFDELAQSGHLVEKGGL